MQGKLPKFLFPLRRVYTRLSRGIKQRGVFFTEDEVRYLVDIVDIWIEGHKDTGLDADDDEVPNLFENMSIAVDVRNKLWRRLTGD